MSLFLDVGYPTCHYFGHNIFVMSCYLDMWCVLHFFDMLYLEILLHAMKLSRVCKSLNFLPLSFSEEFQIFSFCLKGSKPSIYLVCYDNHLVVPELLSLFCLIIKILFHLRSHFISGFANFMFMFMATYLLQKFNFVNFVIQVI